MIQSLDVISVNLWQTLISLANLTVIYIIIKKIFYNDYMEAKNSKEEAYASKLKYENSLKSAKDEAEEILKDARETAKTRGEKIVEEARAEAGEIVRRAESEAELTIKKAADGIKREIVDVSGVLAEKIIGREINTDDHRELIDSFIREMGDDK